MKTNATGILIIIFFTSTCVAQTTTGTAAFRKQLETINRQMMLDLQHKNTTGLLRYYADSAVCMPEYHTTLYNKPAVESYYRTWLNNTSIQDYQRTIYEVHLISNYLIETGTFTSHFTNTGKASVAYDGKYIVLWKIGKNNTLTRLSEIWGSNQYIDRAQLDFSQKGNIIQTPNPRIKTVLSDELDKRNAIICQFVATRDGVKLASMYTSDAVYMPYYSPMLAGIDKIKAYYIEHENPGVSIDSISINASKIITADSLLLVNAYYIVKWRAGNDQGTVTGKSVNVWKRTSSGELMLYRQMTNHD